MSFDGIILMCLIFLILINIAILNSVAGLNENSKAVKKALDTKSIIPLEEEMTYNSLMVYKFLYDNKGSWYSHREIAKAINIPVASVVGAVTGLTMKNYAYRKKIDGINMVTISEKGISHYRWRKSGL